MTVIDFVWLLNAFAIGMAVGKWMTDKRWAGNATAIQRICCRGALYKVHDVSPWKKS